MTDKPIVRKNLRMYRREITVQTPKNNAHDLNELEENPYRSNP